MIPAISTSEGIPTVYLPLFPILIITAIKDFLEDWKRRQSDVEENEKQVTIINKTNECDLSEIIIRGVFHLKSAYKSGRFGEGSAGPGGAG